MANLQKLSEGSLNKIGELKTIFRGRLKKSSVGKLKVPVGQVERTSGMETPYAN